MITIPEHRKIDPEDLTGLDPEVLKRRVSYDTSQFVASRVNLIRYEFDPAQDRDGFYSYFRIGAEWLDADQTRPIVVVPKMRDIDFIGMFMICLRTSASSDGFASVYDIDFDARPIRSQALAGILSPLLVIQYLSIVRRIADRGLRKGYVSRSANLGKLKGRIDIRRNEALNIVTGHRERIYCNFEEYSVDTPENRLLKKALRASRDMISMMSDHPAHATLTAMCGHCLGAFSNVSDDFDGILPAVKSSKLYREYAQAIHVARTILRRQDMAVTRNNRDCHDMVPVFRMDMSLLFEHYALATLRNSLGPDSVKYQVKGYNGRFIADFLINTPDLAAIVDAKYVDATTHTIAKTEYIRQLSAYARDKVLLRQLGYDTDDDSALPTVPCILLYPTRQPCPFNPAALLDQPVRQTVRFYTCPLAIPTMPT